MTDDRDRPPRPGRDAIRALAFLAAALVAVLAAAVALGTLAPSRVSRAHPPTPVLALGSALLLLVTWAALRLEGRPLRAVGLRLDRRRLFELAGGLLIGGAGVAALAWALMLGGTVHWRPNPAATSELVARWTAYFVAAALLEELVFRGYALQRLADAVGPARAVAAMAAVFGAYHVVNVGTAFSLQDGGWDLVWRIAGPAAGGVVFGVAAVRTRGLALPFGVHLGWNLLQWHFLTLAGPHPVGLWTPIPGPYAAPTIFQVGYLYAMLAVGIAVWSLPLRGTASRRPRPLMALP